MAKVLKDQTLYQCEECGKRLLTPHGAKLHETKYCSVVRQREKRKRQESCEHKHMEMSYCPMAGEEHLLEPDYYYCVDCGMTEMDIRQQKKERANVQ
ncbi:MULTISPECIES: hypothetical protein [Bacillus]|uniref:hypothetical protein n=1 Tax=Bacillus TaxID=1386 RepID=UPI00226CBAA1|nr:MULTISPECIES: hypothetical protein [Bacillus]MCY1093957.1 hypothetical protein [Bacillus safensis]MCY7446359.1 hypothetical protein [Bacillus safensis]MCY7459168.1 hypothetical protein [Bacillus safensis]MCY7468116.1 hypothetical protein [Bacillus safensis]MDH6595830.1 DNA-directed RNA polymerase subunit RPC12/RpoP [Bacillus aerius]